MDIYDILKKLDIKYKEVKHSPVYTIKDAKALKLDIEGIGTKSLFLKNKKNYYLVIMEENKKADLKKLTNVLNVNHLSFAGAQELNEILNLENFVTPFGIIEDRSNFDMNPVSWTEEARFLYE